MVAVIFPGQGSQYVGMGKVFYESLPRAREIFRTAEETTGIGLTELCFSGPKDKLALTENCQPAILTTTIACWHAFKQLAPELNIEVVAGHSLGEFSSLVAAETIAFKDVVSLVRKRGFLMAESAKDNPGGMAAVIGLEYEKALEICKNTVTLANLNCPGQIVVSGKKEALQEITPAIKQAGGRVIPLSVSGAFHSPLMETAGRKFAEELAKLSISAPRIPVVANVTADFSETSEVIRECLRRQITSPVRWEESMRRMIKKGIRTFVEVGPGKVLSKLAARIDKNLTVTNVEDQKSLKETLKLLKKA